MKRSAKAYAVMIAAAGVVLGVACMALTVKGWMAGNMAEEVFTFVMLAVVFILCRSLPLYINPQCAIDMSFICIFAAVLVKGPVVCAALTWVTLPFIFEPGPDKKGWKVLYIFSTQPIKALFNTGNQVISILVAGLLFELAGGVPGVLTLPGILWPSLVFIVPVILLNGAILMILFALDGQVSLKHAMAQHFLDFWPNLLAAAPIGFFIAYLMNQNGGEYMALLFMLPLLLARYAFKLYLDSKKSYYNLISTLSAAMEAKDEYTQGHSKRVEEYAEKIGRAMHLAPHRLEELKVAALLHDIGKIGIDDQILRKPGPLTAQERATIENHPEIGLHIIEGNDFSDRIKSIVLHHHERYDGGGYPGHLAGEDVMLEAYILAVADTYDAITSDRPYRNGRSTDVSLRIISEEAGKQFHPQVAATFVALMSKENGTAQE
ncbi:MAG: HD-GYP domain-containing protein [Eubacteriales bacterium]|nr:HD-GYP domain-containing protein [Eubacteriales bacterium]